jgi:hypothetical protein
MKQARSALSFRKTIDEHLPRDNSAMPAQRCCQPVVDKVHHSSACPAPALNRLYRAIDDYVAVS